MGSKVDKEFCGCVWRISKGVFGDPRRASARLVGRYNGGQVVPGGWWVQGGVVVSNYKVRGNTVDLPLDWERVVTQLRECLGRGR